MDVRLHWVFPLELLFSFSMSPLKKEWGIITILLLKVWKPGPSNTETLFSDLHMDEKLVRFFRKCLILPNENIRYQGTALPETAYHA